MVPPGASHHTVGGRDDILSWPPTFGGWTGNSKKAILRTITKGQGRELARAEERTELRDVDLDDLDGFSPLRRSFDGLFLRGLELALAFVARHWLALFNLWLAAFSTPPLLAPVLAAKGQSTLAGAIYLAYSLACHQMPERSFFILGQKVAYCQRDVAIYLTMLAAALVYSRLRGRVKSLDWRLYLLLIAPMAIDGTTQLFGWRESTWELRVITGVLFGFATVWLAYPMFDKSMRELEWQVTSPPESAYGEVGAYS